MRVNQQFKSQINDAKDLVEHFFIKDYVSSYIMTAHLRGPEYLESLVTKISGTLQSLGYALRYDRDQDQLTLVYLKSSGTTSAAEPPSSLVLPSPIETLASMKLSDYAGKEAMFVDGIADIARSHVASL